MLGPGTGLGEAQLFWDEIQGGYKVWPSEGSHSGFAPRGWKQRALQARTFSTLKRLCLLEYSSQMRGCGIDLAIRPNVITAPDGCLCISAQAHAAV